MNFVFLMHAIIIYVSYFDDRPRAIVPKDQTHRTTNYYEKLFHCMFKKRARDFIYIFMFLICSRSGGWEAGDFEGRQERGIKDTE